MLKFHAFYTLLAIFVSISCKTRNPASTGFVTLKKPEGKPLQMLDDPSNPVVQSSSDPKAAGAGPIITYCTKDTAVTSTTEEKKWLDAFSIEVMERICNKEVEVVKPRIDSSGSKYLDTSWTDGINLTGVTLNGYARGTAITPRHVIYTAHYGYHGQKGETLYFLTMDNRVISRKIIDFKYVSGDDLAVIRLDEDLPGSITPLKILDPAAAKLVPSLVPMLRINQHNKALLVDKRGANPFKPGEFYGTVLINPPERAYEQYYQDMVRFDSSSPTILLLRNQYGVMPIIYSVVTFGGTGQGPLLHNNISKIQEIINGFGDTHKLDLAMSPVTPEGAPSCSLSFERLNDGQTCRLTVVGSANPVTGNPAVTPATPATWNKQGQKWTGDVECPTDSAAFFTATLTGPGGVGRSCESAAVGPILPQCQLSVTRRGNTSTCDVEVTKLIGNPTSNPVMMPANPSNWTSSGDKWTATTSCPVNSSSKFSATLSDANGTGPECKTTVDLYPEIPTCELTAQRREYQEICDITVTRKSGTVSGNPTVSPANPTNWTQNGDQFKATAPCSTESHTTFTASLSGPSGTGPVCNSPTVLSVRVEIPFCELQASRIGLSNQCKLNMTFRRGWTLNPPPVASPRNPTDWMQKPNTNDFEGTTTCVYNGSTNFSAYYPTMYNIPGRVCYANTVEKIPAPSCSVIVSRQQTSTTCNYSVTARSVPGTISSYSLGSTGTKIAWNGSTPATGQFPCSEIADTPLSISVWGFGNPQTGTCQGIAPKLPPPTCNIVAKRKRRTSVCDLSIAGGGSLDLKKAPLIIPARSVGRWNGINWIGTGTCPIKASTTFSATVYGIGGSQGRCVGTPVHRL
jgi:hypothetical protein